MRWVLRVQNYSSPRPQAITGLTKHIPGRRHGAKFLLHASWLQEKPQTALALNRVSHVQSLVKERGKIGILRQLSGGVFDFRGHWDSSMVPGAEVVEGREHGLISKEDRWSVVHACDHSTRSRRLVDCEFQACWPIY